jgi:hypothetical protein
MGVDRIGAEVRADSESTELRRFRDFTWWRLPFESPRVSGEFEEDPGRCDPHVTDLLARGPSA